MFDIFGGYVEYRGGEIGLADLTHLLACFDISPEAVRVTMSRMHREGWFASRRSGRNSYYGLTQRSVRLLGEGRRRIFERNPSEWPGEWQLVIYSVPEPDRAARDRLRKQLAWLGFGPLAPSTWISPRDRRNELGALLRENGFHVDVFTSRTGDPRRDREMARRCWNLEELAAAYRAFIRRTEPRRARAKRLSPEQCFVERIRLLNDYRKFPFRDPDLPADLLPARWVGTRAHSLFRELYDALGAPSWEFFEAVFVGPPPAPRP